MRIGFAFGTKTGVDVAVGGRAVQVGVLVAEGGSAVAVKVGALVAVGVSVGENCPGIPIPLRHASVAITPNMSETNIFRYASIVGLAAKAQSQGTDLQVVA